MSVDKLVDSAQLDADLTSVANAIRTKGGTSASLAFPAGFVSAIQNLPSGGGLSKLAEKSLGTISTSSTSATDTGQTVSVSGLSAYDLLIVETSVNSVTNNRHASTVNLVFLYGTSDVTSKTNATLVNAGANFKVSSAGVKSSRVSTTKYGIYVNTATYSNGTVTLAMYQRYSSTQTGTINGSYTTRVYGVSLVDLIGG